MSYSLHVKSYNKRSLNLLVDKPNDTEYAEEHLVATKGTKYYLIAENKTDHVSKVTIYCDNKRVGSWELHARSRLKIEEKITNSFVFESTNIVSSTVTSDPLSCEIYHIRAIFDPANVVINVPVHMCDHHVNN